MIAHKEKSLETWRDGPHHKSDAVHKDFVSIHQKAPFTQDLKGVYL